MDFSCKKILYKRHELLPPQQLIHSFSRIALFSLYFFYGFCPPPPNHFPELRLPPSAARAGDSPSSCKQAGLRHHLGHAVLVRELLGGETEEACWWDESIISQITYKNKTQISRSACLSEPSCAVATLHHLGAEEGKFFVYDEYD